MVAIVEVVGSVPQPMCCIVMDLKGIMSLAAIDSNNFE